ncbi:FimD/PapC N-terminal domain-containing protein [Escherichia coli]
MADLSRFENGQELPPGTYRVDIYLNNGYMATRDVTFNTGDSEQGIVPLPDTRATRQYGAEYGFCRRYESAGG